jgi:hypothetical protein
MKNIYFLHIPKTAGTFIDSAIIKGLDKENIPHYANKSSEFPHKINFEEVRYISGHFGTYPIKNSSYLDFFTILRNPLDLSISYFNFVYNIKYDHIYSNIKGYKNRLIKYLLNDENTKIYNNIQSRFLSNSADSSIFYPNNKTREELETNSDSNNPMWFVDNKNTSFDNAVKTIDACSLVGSVENLESFCEKLSKYFLFNLGVNIEFETNKKVNESFAIDNGIRYTTEDAINLLSKEVIEEFILNNKLDYLVYSYALRHDLI